MYYLGIDVGGMSIKGGLVDENGNILLKDKVSTRANESHQVIIEDIVKLCEAILGKYKLASSDLSGIGLGIPGTIDPLQGKILYANNINFYNVSICKALSKYFSCPICIGNDANAAALGELKFGAAKGLNDLILVTLGTGIGTGIVVDGKLILGKGGAGGEGGHIGFKHNGKLCSCGRKGCWESYASATALISLTQDAISKNPESLLAKIAKDEKVIDGTTAFKGAKLNDPLSKNLVKKYVKSVADGIISLVNVFRPELVLIGGGISNEGDALMKKIQYYVNRYAYGGKINPKIYIKKAMLMNDAGILGAVALCMV